MSTITSEEIRIGPLAVRFLVDAEASGGTVAVFECDFPAGAMLPAAHSHDAYEETVYGVRGVVTWTIEGAPVDIAPGQAVCIPRGAVHRFDNNGDEDATALCIVSPGLLGPDYFRELAAVAEAGAGGPPDLAALGAVMRRHGLTPAP